MNREQRIKELRTRQKYDASSMVINLHKIKGVFVYEVYLWKARNEVRNLKTEKDLIIPRKKAGEMVQSSIENKQLILQGKWNNEDPEDLIAEAESIVGKWNCGRQYQLSQGVKA
jgi:hypothetical protein